MKYILLCFLIIGASALYAQSNCGGVIPDFTTSPTNSEICPSSLTENLAVTSSGLLTTEYAVVDNTLIADDNTGDPPVPQNLGNAIVGFAQTPVVDPSAFGFGACADIQVVPVSYDISQVQNFIDAIYNNTFFGASCCNWISTQIPDFCPNLMGAGIASGSDIQNLNDVFTLFSVFGVTGTTSVAGFISSVAQINIDASGLPANCQGGQLPLCYAAMEGNGANYTTPSAQVTGFTDNSPTSFTVNADNTCGYTLEYSYKGGAWQASSTYICEVGDAGGDVEVRPVGTTTCTETVTVTKDNVLPIELSLFNAFAEESVNRLVWETSTEVDGSHFEIQSSHDGIHFLAQVEMAANGTIDELSRYTWVDQRPLIGNTYYRLLSYDLDGDYEISPVRVVQRTKRGFTLNGFPNPVKSTFNVVLEGQFEGGEILLELFNVSGQMLYSKEFDGSESLTSHQIDVEHLPKGVYVLHANYGTWNETMKFVKK